MLPLDRINPSLRFGLLWAALVLTGALLGGAFYLVGMPAPLLIGSLLAGIIFATNGMKAKIPRPLFLYAQGVIGVLWRVH